MRAAVVRRVSAQAAFAHCFKEDVSFLIEIFCKSNTIDGIKESP